jgi:hypothetical protein
LRVSFLLWQRAAVAGVAVVVVYYSCVGRS